MTDEQKRLVHGALVDADHLAACCEKMLAAMNRRHAAVERGEVADEADIEACAAALVELEQAESDVSECWRAIRSATYEYRKRAERARAAFTPNAEVRGASRPAGEASSAEGATSTVVLEGGRNET